MGTLSQSYIKKYKKYDTGGNTAQPGDSNTPGMAGMASMASGLIDTFNTPDQYGKVSTAGDVGSDALKYGAMGAAFGPIGAGVGAAVGAGIGLLSANAANAKADQAKRLADLQKNTYLTNQSQARISADPSQIYGNLQANYYAANGGSLHKYPDGGSTTQKSLSPQQMTDWNSFTGYLKDKGMQGNPQLDSTDTNIGQSLMNEYKKANPNFSLTYNDVPTIQQSLLARRDYDISQFKSGAAKVMPGAGTNYENYMSDLSKPDGWLGSKTSSYNFPSKFITNASGQTTDLGLRNAVVVKKHGGLVESYMATGGNMPNAGNNLNIQPTEGGTTTALSSTTSQFNGPSHEDGGIQIPGKDAEVEGGETASGDYIFSDRLGFAKLHRPIAKAMGTIESKTLSPERVNSMKLLVNLENNLRVKQEAMKQMYGLN